MAIVACLRYTRSQTPYYILSLSVKCGECVRKGKKYKPVVPVVDFSFIDKVIEKLERKEVETEATLDTVNT